MQIPIPENKRLNNKEKFKPLVWAIGEIGFLYLHMVTLAALVRRPHMTPRRDHGPLSNRTDFSLSSATYCIT